MIYRRRASALHAARAGVGAAYCAVLGLAGLVLRDPIGLGAVIAAILAAGAAAGVGAPLRRAARYAVPIGLAVAVINALVDRSGLTVIVRLGDLPVLGQTDITLEATVTGAMLGLRAVALVLAGALYTVLVDPDEMLRLMRRVSFRSALTATLATRMVPVLARDGRRLADARRCRPGRPPSRAALLQAACGGMLDRALDVAAALEVRGYRTGSSVRAIRRAWSRHDRLVAAAAAVLLGLVGWGRYAGGAAAFSSEPALHLRAGLSGWLLAGALVVIALMPLVQRRGIE